MSFLVVLTVDDIELCPAVLDAWEAAGAPGITILESSGLGRIRKAGLREDIPLMPSLHDLLANDEVRHRTLFAVVDTQAMVDRLVQTAHEAIGDLDAPNSGFLFVVPVLQAFGLRSHAPERPGE